MTVCAYPYCRARLDPVATDCPRCGLPVDPARRSDPSWASNLAFPDVGPILDMHQILPAGDGAVAQQLAWMDRVGVERALLQSVPPQVPSLQGDAAIAQARAACPGRFWASAFVDPRHPLAIDALQAHAQRGTRVVKLLPVTGWSVDDAAIRPFWAAMQALGLVAMVHTGFVTARHKAEEAAAGVFLDSRLANPLDFDSVCRRFPALTVILCHAGGAVWAEEAAEMVSQHEHVWADLSGSGIYALERLLRGVAVDWRKLFWGNDSRPEMYPTNLRLLVSALDAADARSLTRDLVHGNGAQFAERYLG